MTASRKLAAILAADVVGYSRMMGEDEAGTAEAVRERREAAQPIIAAHSGRLFKTMGDGMLIEFPSVVAAVECALAMQRQMATGNESAFEAKRFLYRIGVHLGDVLVEGEDILGDGVNIASRLEAVAEPGGVCVSGAAHEHVRGRIQAEFIDLGEKALKNIARPVRVYAVRIDSDPSQRTPHSAPSEVGPPRLSIVVLPFANIGGDLGAGLFRRWGNRKPDHRSVADPRLIRHRAEHGFHLSRQGLRRHQNRARVERPLCARRKRPTERQSHARQRAAH